MTTSNIVANHGWAFFRLKYLHPLEIMYDADDVAVGVIGNKVGFKPESIEFINLQLTSVHPAVFKKFCFNLATFCHDLYKKRDDLPIYTDFPWLTHNDTGPIVSLQSCERILNESLETFQPCCTQCLSGITVPK